MILRVKRLYHTTERHSDRRSEQSQRHQDEEVLDCVEHELVHLISC